jgi:transposase
VVDIRCLTQPGRKTPKGRKTKRLLITKRLHEYIQIESLLRPDLAVANSTDVSVKIVRAIRKKFTAILEKEVRFKTPRVLGIDGVRVDGTLCTIITDIEEGVVVDLLKGHNKSIITKWIEGRPDKEKIHLVTMDMSITESSAIEEALPHSSIIIDKFHILKMANEMMDAVRLIFYPKRKKDREPGKKRYPRPEPFRMRRSKLEGRRKYLEVWFKIQPQLEIAYNLKEDFLEIWEEEFADVTSDTGRSAAARKRFEEWEKKIPQGDEYKALREKCDKITGAVRDWGTYIFNYFNYPFTNAFTESANRWVKDDKRDLRGCSFETAKARLVFGTYLKRERVNSIKQEEAQLRPNLHNPRKQNVDTAIKRARREVLARLKEAGGLEPQGLIQTSFDFLN